MLTALERLGREIRSDKGLQEISAQRELELIREVQETGSTEAFEELCRGYARALRSCLKNFQSSSTMNVDEALSEVLIGFYELVTEYDLEGDHSYRLAYKVRSLKYRISLALDQQKLPVHVAAKNEDDPEDSDKLSPRTLARYRSLHRKYNGELMEMYKNVKEVGLAAETMMDIHAVLNFEALDLLKETTEVHADELIPYGPGERDDDLVALAFASIAFDQRYTDVVWHTYNFDEPSLTRRRTDGDVGEILDLSRSVVQRAKAGALAHMREVLIGAGSDNGVSAA